MKTTKKVDLKSEEGRGMMDKRENKVTRLIAVEEMEGGKGKKRGKEEEEEAEENNCAARGTRN